MTHSVAVKGKEGEYKHYMVPRDVYVYIRQLESYISYPEYRKTNKLFELYPGRFWGKHQSFHVKQFLLSRIYRKFLTCFVKGDRG